MRAAPIRVIQDISIAWADSAPIPALPSCIDDPPDAFAHRTQVHRDMRRVGDQRALRVEDGAGEVEPFLDVDARRRRLKRDAHLLGDGHEQVVEDLEPDRVDIGADGLGSVERRSARKDQRTVARTLRAPTGIDDDSGSRLKDQSGTDELLGGTFLSVRCWTMSWTVRRPRPRERRQ